MLEPSLVVADEPVSMLDVSLRAGILRLMLDLRERRNLAYLFITHDLSLAWVVADRIAVVYLGRIVEIGTAAEVIGSPRHPYTKALVSVIPVPEAGAAEEQIVLRGETPSARNVPQGCRFHPRCWRYEALGRPEACVTRDPVLEGAHGTACHSVSGNSARKQPRAGRGVAAMVLRQCSRSASLAAAHTRFTGGGCWAARGQRRRFLLPRWRGAQARTQPTAFRRTA